MNIIEKHLEHPKFSKYKKIKEIHNNLLKYLIDNPINIHNYEEVDLRKELKDALLDIDLTPLFKYNTATISGLGVNFDFERKLSDINNGNSLSLGGGIPVHTTISDSISSRVVLSNGVIAPPGDAQEFIANRAGIQL